MLGRPGDSVATHVLGSGSRSAGSTRRYTTRLAPTPCAAHPDRVSSTRNPPKTCAAARARRAKPGAKGAAKPERSEVRGGTLPTRVRVMPNYGWGWAGGFSQNLPTPIAFAALRWRWRCRWRCAALTLPALNADARPRPSASSDSPSARRTRHTRFRMLRRSRERSRRSFLSPWRGDSRGGSRRR